MDPKSGDRLSRAIRGAAPGPSRSGCPNTDRLARYLDHPDDPAIEAHLAECADCRRALLAAGPAPESVEVRSALKNRILNLVAPRPSISTRRRLGARTRTSNSAAAFTVGVAAALLLAVGVVVVSSRTTPEPEPEGQTAVAPPQTSKPPINETRVEPKIEEKKPEEKKEEKVAEEKKPGEKKEERRVEENKPKEKEKERGAEAKRPEDKKVEEKTDLIAIERVSGEIRLKDRLLKAGDRLSPADLLRTPFGTHASVQAAGATLILHQQTELSLAPGPIARLSSGQIYVKSTPALTVETSAGRIVPSGTEFGVEVSGGATVVAVREGAVLFQNARGRVKIDKGQIARFVPGQTLGTPRAVDAAYFDWARKSEADPRILLYPGTLKNGVVITAPHAPYESSTDRIATHIAEQLKSSLVIAHGYRERGIDVNRPEESPKERGAFEEYVKLVREGAGMTQARLVVEIHGYAEKEEPPAIECSTSGLTKDEVLRAKISFAQIVRKRKPDVEIPMVCELTDPTYELNGKSYAFRWGAGALRKSGIFKSEISSHGIKLELPSACRKNAKVREQYEAILAEWLSSITIR